MPNAGNHAVSRPGQKLIERPVVGVLDQSANAARLPPGTISTLVNYVYRTGGGVAKRTGSGVDVGTGATGSGVPIRAGVRWYRGSPSALRQMIVQSGDQLFVRNETTGAYTLIGSLNAGSSPAFFAAAFDPAQSGVLGTPASDVLVIAYGSGPPLKWDGANLTQLSSGIANFFAGCETWHNHVWFWGDPNNPDVVFGTDLNQPESYAFSTNFGGYQIGPGDGDATVQRVIDAGPVLAVIKTGGTWFMQGYDYYAGNYQFSLTPGPRVGTTAPHSVARYGDSAIILWTGAQWMLLGIDGSRMTLSVPIEAEIGSAARGSQSVIRGVSGSFLVQGRDGLLIPYEDVYLCAVDDGSGNPQKVLLYDGVRSGLDGKPAWTVLSGWNVGAWIPWAGPGDEKLLYYGDAAHDRVLQVGQNAASDAGAPITTVLQLNRDDCGSPDQDKWLDYAYLRADSNATTFAGSIVSGAPAGARPFSVALAQGLGMNWGDNWGNLWGATSGTAYQSGVGKIDPWLRGKNFTLTLTESSTRALYEILGWAAHVIEESYARS